MKQRGRETAEVEARLAEGAKALSEQRELVAELKGELGEKNKVSARQGRSGASCDARTVLRPLGICLVLPQYTAVFSSALACLHANRW